MKTNRPRGLRFWLICIVIVVVVIQLKTGVTPQDPAATRDSLDGLLAKLSQDRITLFTDRSWCRLLAATDVTYMNPPKPGSGGACAPPDTTTIAFDQRGEYLFRATRRAMDTADLDLYTIAVQYRPDGTVSGADFAVENHLGHSWYLYSPQRPVLDFHKGTVTQIGGGWVFIETD